MSAESGYDMGGRWAAELFPQHTKRSGVAAVLRAADQITAHTTGRDEAIFAELDDIDQADEWEDN